MIFVEFAGSTSNISVLFPIESASLSGSFTNVSFGRSATVVASAGGGGGAAPSSLFGVKPGV